MKELSSLQIERLKYQPKLPASLAGGINNLNMVEMHVNHGFEHVRQN